MVAQKQTPGVWLPNKPIDLSACASEERGHVLALAKKHKTEDEHATYLRKDGVMIKVFHKFHVKWVGTSR